MSTGPLDRLDAILPKSIREVVERTTPIPTIAARAAEIRRNHPDLVRADIGQISGLDPDLEVLYGPPVGLEELRTAVAEMWTLTFNLKERPGLEDGLRAANVAITTGAAEALTLMFHCFAKHKVTGLPRGHWENYVNGVTLAEGRTTIVDYFDSDGYLDIPGLARRIDEDGISVLVANFPCNPTGAVFDESEAQRLANLAREKDLVIIADEVYSRLRFDGHRPVSLIEYAPERAVIISSASKEYLLPGARVGYIICAHDALTNGVLRKLTRANTASPSVLGQRALLKLLLPDLEDLRAGREPRLLGRIREELRTRKEGLVTTLKKHGFDLVGRAGHDPMGTIFLMAGLPSWWDGNDETFAEAALEQACVSVVPGSAFGLPDSVRFSFGGMTKEAIGQLDVNLAKMRG